MLDKPDTSSRKTDKFERKRAEIVRAAIDVANAGGLKNMRLADVGDALGLGATALTYYFRKRDDLAEACFNVTYDVIHECLEKAEQESHTERRILALLQAFIGYLAKVDMGEAAPILMLSEIKALAEPHRKRTLERYSSLFRRVEALFHTEDMGRLSRLDSSIRAQIVLEQLYWLKKMLNHFPVHQYDGVALRLHDVLCRGMAPAGQSYAARDLAAPVLVPADDPMRQAFYSSAMRTINEWGYQGASVDRIAAGLNLTKGAFYHYIDAKDDLVRNCFRLSLNLMLSVQSDAEDRIDNCADRLASICQAILAYQFGDSGPLLRGSALEALHPDDVQDVHRQIGQIEKGFAAVIIDGIARNQIRPIDPCLGGAMLQSSLNAAADMPTWRTDVDWTPHSARYVDILMRGVLCRPLPA